MIFDNEHITELVVEWQITHDKELLGEILEGCQSLVEALISYYNPIYRDDLIQESLGRIQYSLNHFNPGIAKLHSYLTTVIRNTSITFLQKSNVDDGHVDIAIVEAEYSEDTSDITILHDLITRNRERFPSIPVEVIDEATEMIYYSVRDGIKGRSRGLISSLVKEFDLPRNIAKIIYQSSVVWMRVRYIEYVKPDDVYDESEFTLLTELRDLIGVDSYNSMLIVFSGMYMRIP